jgi:cytoskeletal protein CcmA (bactofilin family)
LSEKSRRLHHSPGRTDSLIGAGLRIEGNIASTGVLRIQGDVQGDVTCDADSGGMVVVDKSGSVAGVVRARHIIVSGRVSGPLHSSESIEIKQGAHIAGDAFYRNLDIQPGGVLEGTLTPCGEPGGDRLPQAPPESAIANGPYIPPAIEATADGRPGRRRKIAVALTLLVAVLAVALLNRNPAPNASPAAASAPAVEPAAAKALTAENAGAQDGPKAVAGKTAPPVAGADTSAKADAQAPPLEQPDAGPEPVVKVQGVNPGKPAGSFLLVGKEPSVLYRKKRQDPGDGKRIDVAHGTTSSIPVARDEIVRVAEGRDLEIFYQGRKVSPKTIESGAWMNFVPQSSGGGR